MKYIFFFAFFLLPIFAHAEIIVSEIAWMGNSSFANAEWIEIKNEGSASVNLSGWTLKAEDGSPFINLSGSISSGQYSLLERASDSTVPSVSALLTYSGALANDGEHLVLRDGNGNIIQNLDFSSGWPAGNNTTKETMQWNGSIWITAEGTPGSSNASFDSGSSGDQGNDGFNEEEADEDEEDENTSSSSSVSSSPHTETYTKELVEIKTIDSSVPVGSPVKFSLKTRDLKGANILRGHFWWNMGDGTERFFNKNEKFEHIYDHEGTYIVYLKYYSTYFEGMEPDATSKITITVSSPNISVNKIHLDGSVELKNNSSQEIDLSDWILQDSSGKRFVIPKETFIASGKNLVLNSKRIRLNSAKIILLTPSGAFASYKDQYSTASSNTASTVSYSNSSSKSATNVSKEEESDGNDNINLNKILDKNSEDLTKQKQPSVWMIVFVVMIVSVCILVFFIYKNKDEDSNEEEFDLID